MGEAAAQQHGTALDDRIAEAATLLRASNNAVITGLATDSAGAEAAYALARKIGAAVDHVAAAAALRDLEVMREAGWLTTTPLQARAQADLVLLAGPGLLTAWPDLVERLSLHTPPTLWPERHRRVVVLCPGGEAPSVPGGETFDAEPSELPALLATLRALAAGRTVRTDAPHASALRQIAEALAAARYGVVVWSAAGIDTLTVAMLCGLIDDLNAKTRFAGLKLPADGNAAGVVQAAGWSTGFPVRVGFGRGAPKHDPWRFDATRMVESGEADVAVWISSLTPRPPPTWRRNLPIIALVAPDTQFASPAAVTIWVGCPGVDHDAVLYDPNLGALAAKQATAPSPAPTVADVLRRIAAAIPQEAAC
jgi:formylmethanofuran dehydrogenase subunit B